MLRRISIFMCPLHGREEMFSLKNGVQVLDHSEQMRLLGTSDSETFRELMEELSRKYIEFECGYYTEFKKIKFNAVGSCVDIVCQLPTT
jgi:hypothetical protein